MKIISYLNRIIEYSFYALFLLVPLVFSSSPSELFEFPKMWLTFGITILIGTSWFAKMILQGRFQVQRTPLDLPILLFLLSQIISTIFSIDPHVSLWGYYSRFNGGLLSMISYLLLYYAFVSNLTVKHVLNVLKISLFSGLIVALWGFPSHFGIDPTCFVFRQSFDTSCWTEAFKPTIRIFSTLGQPAWMAAYMGVLIPISLSFFLRIRASSSKSSKENQESRIKNQDLFRKGSLTSYFLLLTSLLFYACLIYTNTRGGFIAFWIANAVFWGGLILSLSKEKGAPPKKMFRLFLIFNVTLLLCNFLAGSPIESLNRFSLSRLTSSSQAPSPVQIGGLEGTNITDSGNIRLLVWRGAIDTWKANPLIGTGVETFAYSYYKYKPVAHNLTSEWDYLYNKAHNEYLNYLATTGVFGLVSYLAIIGAFIFQTGRWLMADSKWQKENENNHTPYAISYMLITGLFSGYISILISNFFGFSVVIINLYFFLIPAFVFILSEVLDPKKILAFPSVSPVPSVSSETSRLNLFQWTSLGILLFASCFLLINLITYWNADVSYAMGSNLNRAGSYQEALKPLQDAVNSKPGEPVYKDELSINLATLGTALLLENDPTQASKFSSTAIRLSDRVTKEHPQNVVFWKNRVRLFYTLAQGDKQHEKSYLKQALASIEKARLLAPNDAKISYNLGILKGQISGPAEGIKVLEETVRLKPDYRDAYFALGLYYHETGDDKKAIASYQYILKYIDPNDKEVKKSLEDWQ